MNSGDLNASNATTANRYVVMMLSDVKHTAWARGLSFLKLFCELFLIYTQIFFADFIETFILNARSG